MKFRNQFIKYMAPAEDGSEGGSGGGAPEGGQEGGQEGGAEGGQEGGDEPKTYTPEQIAELETQKANLLKESMKRKEKIGNLESELQRFEGVDVELYKTMIQERQEAEAARQQAEEEQLLKDGEYETLLQKKTSEHEGIIEQMRTKHTGELEAERTRYSELEASNKALLGQIEELTVGAAFGNSQMIREDLISAMTPARVRALYGSHFESNEKGEVIGYDKPKGVEGRAPIVDSQGNAVAFDDALKTILETQGDFDSMLRSKVNGSGSGTQSGKSDGGKQVGSGINRIEHALNNQG